MRSVSASGSESRGSDVTLLRLPVLLTACIAMLGVACDALKTAPGHDFGVRVLNPLPISAVGRITVPVRIAVAGCDSFDAVVSGGAGSHAIDFVHQGDGTHLAAVPVDWLREEDGACLHDSVNPLQSQAELVVTCHDAGRSAIADLPVAYGTATRAWLAAYGLPQASIQYLFRSSDPLQPYALSPSSLEDWAGLFPLPWSAIPLHIDGYSFLQNPLVRTRLAVGEFSVFVTSGCWDPASCPDIVVSPSATSSSELVFGVALNSELHWHAYVPSPVVDLAFAPSGELVALSQLTDASGQASVITRVLPAPEGETADVQVIGYFPRELVQTRFSRTADGQLEFLSFVLPSTPGPLLSVLHATDGQVVVSDPDPTGDLFIGDVWAAGSLSIASVQLAPDASTLAVSGHPHVGPPGSTTWDALPTTQICWFDGDRGGVAWLSDAIALWNGASMVRPSPATDTGLVEVFEATPPHSRVYGYEVHGLPGASGAALLHGATAVGDKLVLTTNTGIRVLGHDGTLIGGSDPLPCRLTPSAIAIQSGPTQVAVGAGSYLYVFDLAQLDN